MKDLIRAILEGADLRDILLEQDEDDAELDRHLSQSDRDHPPVYDPAASEVDTVFRSARWVIPKGQRGFFTLEARGIRVQAQWNALDRVGVVTVIVPRSMPLHDVKLLLGKGYHPMRGPGVWQTPNHGPAGMIEAMNQIQFVPQSIRTIIMGKRG